MESLDMIDNSPVTIATWIALCGGLRKDEVCGLRWDDVDMEDDTLRVRRCSIAQCKAVHTSRNLRRGIYEMCPSLTRSCATSKHDANVARQSMS
jgi:integrase